jgi:nitroimidazol reductase NimA-like FMN-containing flavoprotein (pyridoxamine 5'-phosphate oxidase superfamily)
MSTFPLTDRTRLERHPERGSLERALIHEILDEGLICHVSFVHDGHPVVLPTAYVRLEDRVYLHGSNKNRMLEVLAAGAPCCLAVTLLDGFVLARSQFAHSMNYRSVVIFGHGERVVELEQKRSILAALCDHLVPGRSSESRTPTEPELTSTHVIAVPLTEASAKCRRGPPLDREGDLGLPHWAGVLPLELRARPPERDPKLAPNVDTSLAVERFERVGRAGVSPALR